jgi:hypothetical protein
MTDRRERDDSSAVQHRDARLADGNEFRAGLGRSRDVQMAGAARARSSSVMKCAMVHLL